MADRPDRNPGKDVSRVMSEARDGQDTVDLEAWAPKSEAFIDQQACRKKNPSKV